MRAAALMCYDSWRERGPLAAVDGESRSLLKDVTPAGPRAGTQLLSPSGTCPQCEHAQRVLADDPCREDAYRLVMRPLPQVLDRRDPGRPVGHPRHTKDSRIGVARASLATLYAPAPARAA
jgi:hypothetical protein